jgi:ATP-binding cassette subfamily B protein
MAWGGGFGGGGFGGGAPMGGSRGPSGGQPGLPFAGIPSELQLGVDKILLTETLRQPSDISFSPRPEPQEREQLTLTKLLLEHPGLMSWSAVLVVIVAITSQLGPALTAYAVNNGMANGHHSYSVVLWSAIAYLIIVIIGSVAQRSQVRASGRLSTRVMHNLRIRVFKHLQRLGLDFYTEEKAGVVMTRMTSDIENLQQLLQDGLSQFALQALTMVTITIILFLLNPVLAAITVGLIVPPLALLSWWFHHASERGYDRVRDGIAAVLSDLSESLQGVRVVASYNRQARNVTNHREVVGHYRDANVITGRVNAIFGPGSLTIGVLGQAILLGIGGDMVLHHSLSIGALIAFFLYLNRFFQPIQLLVQQYNSVQQSRSSIIKLRTLLETEPSVMDAPEATTLDSIQGAIRFDNVSFGYDPERPVLHDINLSIHPGETIAFVGPTGGGKSTLAKLIIRFYDPDSGMVSIDDHDLREVTQQSLRRQLGVVPQEPFLFAGTIKDNLTFARADATGDDVDEAIDRVGLRDLIDRLPLGVETIVHERGQTLSAGERQLLALGRAFIAQPRVLVLDEATSSLDLASETAVEHALDALLESRTAVLIAHRLSTAQRADRIVVIQQGRIVEVGSHADLMSDQSHYAQMFATWSQSGLIPDPDEAPAT